MKVNTFFKRPIKNSVFPASIPEVPSVIDDFIYDFEFEKNYLGSMDTGSNNDFRDIYHSEPITYESFVDSYPSPLPEQTKSVCSSTVRDIVEEFDPPNLDPFDMVRHKSFNGLKELRKLLVTEDDDCCRLPLLEPKKHSKKKTNENSEAVIAKKKEHISSTQSVDIPENLKNIYQEYLNMGFDKKVINFVLNACTSVSVETIDDIITVQDILNSGVSLNSIKILKKSVGNDLLTVKAWSKNLATLKELGYQEDIALEALIGASGKLEKVIDVLQK